MPPSPILAVTEYGPRVVPGLRDMGQSAQILLVAFFGVDSTAVAARS